MSDQPQNSSRVEVLDYLRVSAATAVVCLHWLVNGIRNGKVETLSTNTWATGWASYGWLGVTLFFLISGYVIRESTLGRSPGRFLVGRFVRLYPTFWLALAATTLMALAYGGPKMGVTGDQVLANLTMTPVDLGQKDVDGAYWTLSYELRFYALAFVVLFVAGRRWFDAVMIGWIAVMTVASAFLEVGNGHDTMLGGHFFAFACGAVIAMIRMRGATPFRLAALAVGFVGLLRWSYDDAVGHQLLGVSPTVCLVLVTLFVLALMATWSPRVAGLRLPWSRQLGALTYPMYLLHAHIGYMCLNLWGSDDRTWWLYPAMFAGLVLAAYTVNHTIESRAARRAFTRVADLVMGRPVDALHAALGRALAGLRPTGRPAPAPAPDEAPALTR